jgi:hypothetical protein
MAAHQPLPGPPSSPGGACSGASTPTGRALAAALSPFRRGPGNSPLSDGGGAPSSAGGTPQRAARSLIPSYGHSVQKREVIRQQEEQLGALRQQAEQQGQEIGRRAALAAPSARPPRSLRLRRPTGWCARRSQTRASSPRACRRPDAAALYAPCAASARRLRSELASERHERASLQERLNMQHFKSRWGCRAYP